MKRVEGLSLESDCAFKLASQAFEFVMNWQVGR